MKALSIQQPWAWAILRAGKDIENRDWPTKVRGRILVHVGKKYDDADDFIERTTGLKVPTEKLKQSLGGIVGCIDIVDCVDNSESEWFFGKFGFVLRNPIVLPFMPIRGKLGFFDVQYNRPELLR